MEKIYGMHKLMGLQLFWSGTPTFSSGTPTFCQMGVLNSCFQNPSESSAVLAICYMTMAGSLFNSTKLAVRRYLHRLCRLFNGIIDIDASAILGPRGLPEAVIISTSLTHRPVYPYHRFSKHNFLSVKL